MACQLLILVLLVEGILQIWLWGAIKFPHLEIKCKQQTHQPDNVCLMSVSHLSRLIDIVKC